MTREEKIKAIYEEMANKELSFGCKIITNEYRGDEFRLAESDSLAIKEGTSYRTVGCDCCSNSLTIKEIIGHPVMIGDVLRQIRLLAGYALDNDLIKKSDFGNVIAQHNYRITQIWENFREPIEDQSDECIDYVYSLIQKD